MSLHISSIETLNKPAHIFVYFCFLFCWFGEEKKQEMQKELTMPREDEPNLWFGFDDHRFHMFTDDMRSGRRGGSDGELLGPLNPHSHDHCSAHSCNPRLRVKRTVSRLLNTDERKINVNFLTRICRQTVFVKKSFWFFFLFILFVNNKPWKYRK